jgi:hypothetical protein
LSDGQELYVSSDYTLYSDGMMQTSWSGFKLDDVINMEVVFRAARVTSIINSPINAAIPLDKLIINIGQAWDACNSQLVVPKTGIYFLSWSAASFSNITHVIELQVNGAVKSRSFIYTSYPGSDTSSQALLLPLNTGDVVKLILTDFLQLTSIYSDMNYQTSFSGFLYEPVHGQAVAWSLTLPSIQIFRSCSDQLYNCILERRLNVEQLSCRSTDINKWHLLSETFWIFI